MWPASVKAVGGSTELSLVGYPLLVFFFFFFFRASTCLCFCAFKLTLVPTIATVHLFCLLALASYKLCYPFCFSFVDNAAFQKLLHFFSFFFFLCVWINGSLAHSISWLYLVAAMQSNVQLLHVGSSIHYLHFRVEYYTPFRWGAMLWKLCKYGHQNLLLCVFRLCFAVRQWRLLVQACTWGCCDCAENKKSNEKQIEVKQCVSC